MDICFFSRENLQDKNVRENEHEAKEDVGYFFFLVFWCVQKKPVGMKKRRENN